ncbi:LysM peptidoglycan-binding domain-containing protein [Desulfobacula phenolica]|uniref:LysM domain-containing protein n=1 Tax=Desulfobacula phenolica TaxID=90732 RepID=A0A1H2DP09_9BACT|nr:LysM peptidoglycan-binding domain-containing protein [Desulfobacula phenolica]SDT84461.1 LysM domain-containing protein [Desulfobacula phenolica]
MRNQGTMIAAFALTIWAVALCSTGFAGDYKEFIIGEDSGFYYTIQKGDTLWDLSEKFYSSQWDWPGLWEMNDDIKNPHQIYPGKKIRVFLKETPLLKPKIVTVRETKEKKPPIKIETSFSISGMDHIGFLRKKAQPSLGSIIKEKDDKLMMSTNNIIYIKPSGKGPLVPGRIYQIFTTSDVKEKINDKTFKAVKHLIKAQVKILEHKQMYATALITNAYRPVYKNDLIMEYYKRDSILTVEEEPGPIDARIICSEDDNIMINDYRIAFIDAGTKVKPGQIYSIFRKNKLTDNTLWPLKKKNDAIQLENLESGKLIVLHTEDIASTVMILSSTYAIHQDDMVN